MAKMTKDKGSVFALAVFVLFIGQTVGEIHRAKATKAKYLPKTRTGFFTDSENGVVNELSGTTMDATESVFFTETRKEAWIYSLSCSVVVGLSGIFPLLVIPIESGPALQHGSAANKLKLLLSFAVGGLLGDVFLHLLPEAWAHASSDPDGHENHTTIGLWVLTGILTFLILEKIFAEDNEFEPIGDSDDESETTSVTTTTTTDTAVRQRNVGQNKMQNGDINYNKTSNGDVVANGSVKQSSKEKKPNIKVSGYLNLMANCIDNFTHGLAVAGSFLVSPKVGFLTTFAILIHEIPHEVGDFAILLRSGFNRWKAAKAQLATASGGILGAIFALTADSAKSAGEQTAWILPFTSGGFLYIALVTVVPDLLREKHVRESIKQIICLLGGIFSMLIVTWFVE